MATLSVPATIDLLLVLCLIFLVWIPTLTLSHWVLSCWVMVLDNTTWTMFTLGCMSMPVMSCLILWSSRSASQSKDHALATEESKTHKWSLCTSWTRYVCACRSKECSDSCARNQTFQLQLTNELAGAGDVSPDQEHDWCQSDFLQVLIHGWCWYHSGSILIEPVDLCVHHIPIFSTVMVVDSRLTTFAAWSTTGRCLVSVVRQHLPMPSSLSSR